MKFFEMLNSPRSDCYQKNGKNNFFDNSAAVIDKTYVVVGSNLDSQMFEMIQNGDYVEFGKLDPQDRILMEEDQMLGMVICNGRTYYVPVSDVTSISNFQCWEQAFSIYVNIYMKTNAHHSSELIEYNQIIHTASLNFTWENVYLYDKDFRLHMSRNLARNWGIILQQAWSLRLRDHVSLSNGSTSNHHNNLFSQSPSKFKEKVHEPCRRYNKGRCSFGSSCKYDHRCSYCMKFGHSILTCHKLIADRECNLKKKDNNGSFFQNQSSHHRNREHHGNHHRRSSDTK